MAYKDEVNRILRDHEGYTGDGKGGVGALPVGDRSTARKPIDKKDLRSLFLVFEDSATDVLQARDDAVGAADAAEGYAASAAGASISYPTVQAMMADATNTFPVGTIIAVRKAGRSYEVVATAAEGQATTAAGTHVRPVGGGAAYDPVRVNFTINATVPQRAGDPVWHPGLVVSDAPYLNVTIGADGPSDTALVWRSTLVGHSTGSLASKAFDRVDAFGDGAVRFADQLDSVTAIGSLAYQWLGLQLLAGESMDAALSRTIHDFVTDKPLTDTSWDFAGLETNNPGLRAKLLAVTPATAKADNQENVGLGRNAGLHLVKGARNTIIGKNSLAHGYYCLNNATLGWNAFRDGALIWRCVGVGARAGMLWSEGTDNTVLGDGAGAGINSGSFNIIIGASAASSYTGLQNNLLWIGSDNRPALTGNLFQRKFGFNVAPESILGNGLHIRVGTTGVVGGTVNSGAEGLVIEKSGASTGITVLTDNNQVGQIVFADPQDNNIGGVQYDHATDTMSLKAGDVARVQINNSGLRLVTLPTSASGLSAGQLWNDNGTLKVA